MFQPFCVTQVWRQHSGLQRSSPPTHWPPQGLQDAPGVCLIILSSAHLSLLCSPLICLNFYAKLHIKSSHVH